jgi:iron complex transport system ATP-binding protein
MIQLTDVHSGYGNKEILSGISCTVSGGSLTSVIGPNGCGKTTFLKTIVGIIPLKHGEITVDGKSLAESKIKERSRRIAYLPQERTHPDITVEELVLFGRFPHLSYPRRYSENDRSIAAHAIERVGLEGESLTPLSQLSGGMRQRAYIAMSLAQDTDYILLDEPTSFLDTAHKEDAMRTLRTLANEGKGVVTVMHDLPLAFAYSDNIIVMDGGKILLSSPPDKLVGSPIIQELFGITMMHDDGGFYYKTKNDEF